MPSTLVDSAETLQRGLEMWMRKYATFHLPEMQGDVKQLLGLPGSSREEERLRLPSYKPADLKRWKYCPLPWVDGGICLWMSVDL